ncbi:(2Fe-2S)-binding protein [Mangrovibacterium sp.]|uniref:(2Fe-2S)-binding protein n=1 Tax=Mangrovibacterium sp. TaxID=1961364 RepID=UPI0035686F1F
MSNRLVCICNMVSEQEIINELKKGALDTSDIQYATRAGTSCGKCLMTIDQIVEEYHASQPQDSQGRLNL